MLVPLVSVVMPVHNPGRFLDAAILSIRTQSLADLELILVDDGSTDGSGQVLRRHAAADPRLSVLSIPHGGVATALNRGLAAARADLVARMDADDEAKPERLERQAAVLRARPEVAVLGSGMEAIDGEGRVTGRSVPTADPAEIREGLLRANYMAHPTVMMRRHVVLAAGGYRPAFTASEDYDLWLRLSEHHDLSNLPDLLLRYRGHDGQISGRRWALRLLEVLAAQHAARLRRAGQPDPMTGHTRIDARTLRAIGVPRAAIRAALDGQEVAAPPLRRGWISVVRRTVMACDARGRDLARSPTLA
jgi:glycosyltransferase involved in cell wall biosynthesis